MVLQILWDVPWSAFHSGCSVSLAAAVPLAAAIIVAGAVYFVLFPPPHAWAPGASSLNRLSLRAKPHTQSTVPHITYANTYIVYYVRDTISLGITAALGVHACTRASPKPRDVFSAGHWQRSVGAAAALSAVSGLWLSPWLSPWLSEPWLKKLERKWQ